MGMYTGLRFKAIIKQEYIDDIQKMLKSNNDEPWEDCESDVLKSFAKISRSSFIPFGCLAYMPDCWENEDGTDSDGFERDFNNETGRFAFQCSLKNYDETIEYFINNVVPIICDKLIHCETLYEEVNVSTMYGLNDGKIEELDYGIRYQESDFYKDESYYTDIEVDDLNKNYKDYKKIMINE